MKPQELLESGILETVAMGLGTAQEAELVTAARNESAEVEAAWNILAADLEIAGSVVARKAPAAAKSKLFAAIAAESQVSTEQVATPEVKSIPLNAEKPVAGTSAPIHEAKTVSMNSGGRSWALAASIALALLSGVANVVLYNKLVNTQDQLALAEQNQTVLTAKYEKSQSEANQMKDQLAFAADPSMPRITMGGMNEAKDAATLVIWDPYKHMVQLSSKNLPAVPSDKDLQLWAIVDGKPVDLGLISMNADGVVIEKEIPELTNPQAFAVTLESKGGNPQPLGTMWLVGEVAKTKAS